MNGRSLISKFSYRSNRSSKSTQSTSSSDDELSMARPSKLKTLGLARTRSSRNSRQRKSQSLLSLISLSSQSDGDDYGGRGKRRPPTRQRSERSARVAAQKRVNYSDLPAPEDMLDDESDDGLIRLGKRKRSSSTRSGPSMRRRLLRGPKPPGPDSSNAARRSDRNTGRTRDMREIGEEDIPEIARTTNVAKYAAAKETFKALSSDDEFRLRHFQICDVCREEDDSEVKGMLVFCQGCTSAFHHKCLGARAGREHLVTKIEPKNFVLQCRRCIGFAKTKDPLAPDQGLCLACHEPGTSATAFRERKTAKDEQKEREDNGGEDPVTLVLTDLINNPRHVLFRCTKCYRACHMHHLPPKGRNSNDSKDEEEVADARFDEYTEDWQCKDCVDAPGEVDTLVAWRPTNMDRYEPGQTTDVIEEDAKEYLVKWKKMSFFKVQWMAGPWVWGIAASVTLKAFAKKDGFSNLPKMSIEEAVPEDFLRIDIVLDVEYTNIVNAPSEKVAKARIKEVRKVFVKFKGLGYEDAVWTEPPSPESAERWTDFKAAYEDWVMGSYTRLPTRSTLNNHLNKIRAQDFGSELAMKSQPASLTGELMAYQMEGLNWLYYQWYKKKNAILADEMGLGKTIQVIGFLAALKQLHGVWPFLVVVPNSTCPNWRREIKQWDPSLRVVTYYGSARARKLALDHELFPEGGKDLRCHVVVTSYEAAQDVEFRSKFKGVFWQGLIVDEGQRLKSDKNLLYSALNALRPPFKLLLTGKSR